MAVDYAGVLVIGDPHAGKTGPASRKGLYGAEVLRKLSYAAWLSREWRLLPLITGDLLNRGDGETSVGYLTELMKVLKSFYGGVVRSVGGNHDYGQGEVAQGSAYELLLTGDAVRLCSGGACEDVEVGGSQLRLYFYGHGEPLPQEVARGGADFVWLLTHHDLAFGESYPGCIDLFEIKGADRVVNGHIHGVKRPEVRGCTEWLNLGNITRRERRDDLQCPNVWVWPKRTWEFDVSKGGASEWVTYEEKHEVGWRGVREWESCVLETGWAHEVGIYRKSVDEPRELVAQRWAAERDLYPMTPIELPHEQGVFRFDAKTLKTLTAETGKLEFANRLWEEVGTERVPEDANVELLLRTHLQQVLLEEGEDREKVLVAVMGLWTKWNAGLLGSD